MLAADLPAPSSDGDGQGWTGASQCVILELGRGGATRSAPAQGEPPMNAARRIIAHSAAARRWQQPRRRRRAGAPRAFGGHGAPDGPWPMLGAGHLQGPSDPRRRFPARDRRAHSRRRRRHGAAQPAPDAAAGRPAPVRADHAGDRPEPVPARGHVHPRRRQRDRPHRDPRARSTTTPSSMPWPN